MNSTATTYQLPTFGGLLSHGWRKTTFVRDTAEQPQYEIDALALSGDYFVTLATELDTLSRQADDYAVRLKMESLVSDLIYLQDRYEIIKKESD